MADEIKQGENMHPDTMSTETGMQSSATRVHCCDCWRFTDTTRADDNLVHEAVAVLVNATVLAVEKSEAFTAADAFLASRFKAATRLTAPRF
jgi:hypothetical protein